MIVQAMLNISYPTSQVRVRVRVRVRVSVRVRVKE
jgi:hypothetical protein